ncbi:MAG: hypothetical protein PQJ59_09800 [Spirochaetales bacterium]|nr:hypothetical protein [Spirochaetales bacterium]
MKHFLLGILFTTVLLSTSCNLLSFISGESSDNNITSFSFDEIVVTGEITGTDIALTVPYDTDVTALVATFSSTGTSVIVDGTVQESGVTENNFSSPVTYTVTAEDGSTKNYTATVTIHDEVSIPDSGLLSYGSDTYKLWLPYDFESNFTDETYPLIISLHGSTTLTDHYFAPFIVNDDQESIDYPCLFFAPNNSNKTFNYDNAQWIREVIYNMIEDSTYRIDTNRIYIIGFSMGAHGTTYIAQDLYTDYGYVTAAIVPTGGGQYSYMSATELRDNTSMWIHYGLDGDYSQESDYTEAKAYNSTAVETEDTCTVTYTNWAGTFSHVCETLTLTRTDGIEIAKRSTYDTMGHSSSGAFAGTRVLEWLFEQSLEDR